MPDRSVRQDWSWRAGGAPSISNKSREPHAAVSHPVAPSTEATSRFVEHFAFETYAILLDIDGTLLDLAPTPAGVLVPSRLQATLTTLWKWTGGALALISGRPLKDIDRIFAPLELPAVGGHGAEIRLTASSSEVMRPRIPLLDERIRRQLLGLATRGVIIEDKGYSIAIHFRRAPELGPELHKAVGSIAAGLPGERYEVLPGKAVIEVKPTGFNKGTAVLELMDVPPFKGRRPIFIGDDVTDEAVFAILPDIGGIGFSVGRIIAGASGVFNRPDDVREWLARIAEKVAD